MRITSKDVAAVLATPLLPGSASSAGTIREYFKKLLAQLWCEGEFFSGKRPFGDSGWKRELYEALAHSGLIAATKHYEHDGEAYRESELPPGVVPENCDFFYEDFDSERAELLIAAAIESL